MPELKATIAVDGKEALDLLASLTEMEVEEDHRMAATARVKLCIRLAAGAWRFLDDERVKPWKGLSVSVFIDNEETKLFEGLITQIKPGLVTDENACSLEIVAMDASCLMGIEEKIKNWPDGETDSSIADQVFGDYGMDTEVEDTAVTHDEAISTVIQRETDIRFLKRLARRNGYECFVKGGTGFFRKPVLEDEKKLPTLAAHFGAETNLVSFSARLNALRPTAVEMHDIDFVAKEILDATATAGGDAGGQRQLGGESALSVSMPGSGVHLPAGTSAKMFVKHAVATGKPEMEAVCRALFDEAEWLIEGEGEVDTIAYGSVLEARRLVPIKGVGEVFSGLYYVTNVKHIFKSVSSYTQKFTARRNGLVAKAGDFNAGGLLGGLV
jgi:phage protein D